MKRRNDNERKSNKKKAVIIGLTASITTVVLAFSLYTNYSKKDVPAVETNTPSIESVDENVSPDINDVIKDATQMDVSIEEVTENTEGVETSPEDDIGTSESIVGSETTPDSIVESETTTPSETTTTPVESTEIQPVYEASEAPVPSTEETNKKLEEAGIDMRVEDTSQMTQEEIQAHNQAVYDDIWGDATTGYDDGDNTSVGITIQ